MVASLRAELGAAQPSFDIRLPPGWVRMDASDVSRDALLERTRARFLEAHRPDLWAQSRGSIMRAFDDLRRMRGDALMLPLEAGRGAPFVPASVTAATVFAEGGLDEHVARLVAQGATALDGDRRFLRDESTEEAVIDGVRIAATTVRYLTPVPRTRRTRALLLTAALPHPADLPPDDRLLSATRALIDGMVSTFRWLPTRERG